MRISLKITQASLNQTAFDWPRNMANIFAAIDEAAAQGSDILALEELCLTGYDAGDDFQRTDNDVVLGALQEIADYASARNENLVISIGHPWRLMHPDSPHDRLHLPYNVQSFIAGGRVLAMTAKAELFNNERGYEKRYFNEWNISAADLKQKRYGTININLGGRNIPFGRPIISLSGEGGQVNLCHILCEEKWVGTIYDGAPHDDSRYEERNIIPTVAQYLGSTDGLVLLIPNASPPARDKIDQHNHLAALASGYADAVIDTDGLGSSGSTFAQFGHRLIAQKGRVVSAGERMGFARVMSTTSVIEVSAAPEGTQKKAHAFIPHKFQIHETRLHEARGWDKPDNLNRHYEEVLRYTAFWLFDYMRKTGARGVAQALSGGADSAFNAVIVRIMVELGVAELGMKAFCAELGLEPFEDIESCMESILTCVYMETDNNSDDTRNAAEILARGIGAKYIHQNIQTLVDEFITAYEGTVEGIAYENIQARIRQSMIMLHANVEGKMALSNPNLDEARNAYATFGGDLHSGTINLNAHMSKAYQLEVMRYLHEHGLEGVMGPVMALALVLKNKPTAELQPKDEGGDVIQTDEGALQRSFAQMDRLATFMLYEKIDTSNGARRRNAGEVFRAAQGDALFKECDENTLYNMVFLSYARWQISQHKIHASPIGPTFGRNVDHQASLRTPNISGGHREELVALGVELMFEWAQKEGLDWSADEKKKYQRRCFSDEVFVKSFAAQLKTQERSSIRYDLRSLFERIKTENWQILK